MQDVSKRGWWNKRIKSITIFYQNFKYNREKCVLASVWESLLFTHENKLIEYINHKLES